ncbi:MAG: dTDP-4-dehydrorhamnose 3,5-epimerase [Chitinophagaceae bacterium]|nr:dTDP-4-dehydrorhamnose 3,5-epimerase [Chitinophagaceae bacterium]MCB9046075.1 dTDP-4-dehydrorhamnose 3,5-epimerase [Chitinophagales bacterium]
MNVIETPIKGLLIIEPRVFNDDRGYFFESFNSNTFKQATGLDINFVQDNQARSTINVLRGLHYQNAPHAQTKLIRALEGAIWDVVVDLRKDSDTYGRWYGIELSAENKRQFLVPRGFAHGYSVLTPTAEVFYKCDDFYSKEDEGGVYYADPELNIDWKIDLADAIVSDKDKVQPKLVENNSRF